MAGATTAKGGARRTPPPGPPPPALKARRRLRLPRRRTLLVTGVATALLGSGVIWLLYGSSWLRVDHVAVSGTAALTPGEVREAAAVPLNEPLAAVDTDSVEHRLRARLSRIADVDVSRSWPDTIAVRVTERRPEAIVQKDRKFLEVDEEGVLFATVPQAPEGVPLLEVEADRSPSSRHFGAARLRREAVGVIAQLPEKVRAETLSVRVRSYDSIALGLTRGRTVVWGSSERGAAKAKTLTALMKAVPDAERYDVSAPTAPAVTQS